MRVMVDGEEVCCTEQSPEGEAISLPVWLGTATSSVATEFMQQTRQHNENRQAAETIS